MSLTHTAIAGMLAALIQAAFLFHFGSPLAEKIHETVEAVEEEYAYWSAWIIAAISGTLWGIIFHFIAMKYGVFKTAIAMFIAISLLPGLKWLPTPHGVSYVEPVWWREIVHALYLLYNSIMIFIVLRGGIWGVIATAALITGVYIFPNFTLPPEYSSIIPELRALQGLAISSWALFWALIAILTYVTSPLRRIWK